MFHILTLVFIVLKILAVAPVAAWSWWLVLSPSLVVLAFALLILAVGGVCVRKALR